MKTNNLMINFLVATILISNCSLGQNNEKMSKNESLTTGLAIGFNEIWNVYTKVIIIVEDLTQPLTYQYPGIIVTDNKTMTTLIGIKLSDNYYQVFGFTPAIVNNKFTETGEFTLVTKSSGNYKTEKQLKAHMSYYAYKNEKIYYFKQDAIELQAIDGYDVKSISLLDLGVKYTIPNYTFDFK